MHAFCAIQQKTANPRMINRDYANIWICIRTYEIYLDFSKRIYIRMHLFLFFFMLDIINVYIYTKIRKKLFTDLPSLHIKSPGQLDPVAGQVWLTH